ncbi:MAG: hypothetical protein E4H20_06820 [Spirochaetales bacterium]|nr:MAG: hypothetical protein E4H20_06820 [Spirochaetales bacterium]
MTGVYARARLYQWMNSMGWVSFGLGADQTVLSAAMSMRFDAVTDYGRLTGSIIGAKPTMKK